MKGKVGCLFPEDCKGEGCPSMQRRSECMRVLPLLYV